MNIKIILVILFVFVLSVAGYFLFINQAEGPIVVAPPIVNPINSEIIDEKKPVDEKKEPVVAPQSEKEKLLTDLKSTADKEDYKTFAKYLEIVFEKGWDKEKDFQLVESEFYMKATTEYFDKGNLDKALEVSTIVFYEAPQGWRFRYLRIRTLEKFGRNAFDAGDLSVAENYATKILSMMYRPEGANLLADIYIEKIETNLAAGDKKSALKNLNYIWDFETSQDRRDKLTQLKNQIDAKP